MLWACVCKVNYLQPRKQNIPWHTLHPLWWGQNYCIIMLLLYADRCMTLQVYPDVPVSALLILQSRSVTFTLRYFTLTEQNSDCVRFRVSTLNILHLKQFILESADKKYLYLEGIVISLYFVVHSKRIR